MRALTLHRPWPWAILHLDGARAKRIENRLWAPPDWILGERIAIHAGGTFDIRAAEYIRQVGGAWPPLEHTEHPVGIVGVADFDAGNVGDEVLHRVARWYDSVSRPPCK